MDGAAARRRPTSASVLSADAATWYCGFVFVALIMLSSFGERYEDEGVQVMKRPCEEIYVVGEGETLHTIGDKCGDPYIVEENPHIHDPDDVYPGLVIKITPYPYYNV